MTDNRRPLAENGPQLADGVRTVLIPVRIVDGTVKSISGGALTELNDCIGQLRVGAHAIRSAADLVTLAAEESIPLLPKGTRLFCRLGARHVPDNLRSECIEERLPEPDHRNALFAEIRLEQDLQLRLRGSKPAILLDATCSIPRMPGVQPKSVNEAYRRISERYEPTRRSAGGNVFLSVYIKPLEDSPLVALGTLRDDRSKTWDAYVRTVFKATIERTRGDSSGIPLGDPRQIAPRSSRV